MDFEHGGHGGRRGGKNTIGGIKKGIFILNDLRASAVKNPNPVLRPLRSSCKKFWLAGIDASLDMDLKSDQYSGLILDHENIHNF